MTSIFFFTFFGFGFRFYFAGFFFFISVCVYLLSSSTGLHFSSVTRLLYPSFFFLLLSRAIASVCRRCVVFPLLFRFFLFRQREIFSLPSLVLIVGRESLFPFHYYPQIYRFLVFTQSLIYGSALYTCLPSSSFIIAIIHHDSSWRIPPLTLLLIHRHNHEQEAAGLSASPCNMAERRVTKIIPSKHSRSNTAQERR